jgi:hypothetical protein
MTIGFTKMNCGVCGIDFFVPDIFYQERRQSNAGLPWHCPNGHSRQFRESDLDVARRERDRALQDQARLADELTGKERELRRIKKRISNGVCPCCKRHFSNMERHIKTQHPELLASNVVKIA